MYPGTEWSDTCTYPTRPESLSTMGKYREVDKYMYPGIYCTAEGSVSFLAILNVIDNLTCHLSVALSNRIIE